MKVQIRMKGERFKKMSQLSRAQSEIARVIGLVLLVKAEKFKMLLVVLRNRIFVINFLKRRYLFIIIHVVILVVLIE